MYEPAKEAELDYLSNIINDKGMLKFYRYTSGCIVRNGNGEIRIFSATHLLIDLSKRNGYIGLIPIGFITDVGELFINCEGSVLLFEDGSNSIVKKRWRNIEELLGMKFSD